MDEYIYVYRSQGFYVAEFWERVRKRWSCTDVAGSGRLRWAVQELRNEYGANTPVANIHPMAIDDWQYFVVVRDGRRIRGWRNKMELREQAVR